MQRPKVSNVVFSNLSVTAESVSKYGENEYGSLNIGYRCPDKNFVGFAFHAFALQNVR